MLEMIFSSRLHFVNTIADNACDDYDGILAIVRDKPAMQSLPFGKILSQRFNKAVEKLLNEGVCSMLPNPKGTHIILKSPVFERDLYPWLSELSGLLKKVEIAKHRRFALLLDKTDMKTADAVVRAVLAHTENMPNFKRAGKKCQIKIDIIGDFSESDFLQVLAAHQGNALARYLTLLPTNYLTPKLYIEKVEKLAQLQNWQCEIFTRENLSKMGAGAFSAVARASDGAAIIKLRYEAKVPEAKLLTLVGKGVCFDTGGVSLKPAKYMYGMNDDMMGSAVALGSFLALTQQKVPCHIECYLAVTENNIDKEAFLPNEVISALNGTTVEIVDTDAEGRLALADTLVLAGSAKPDILIDYATLTGAAIRALGSEYCAIFTNRYDWQNQLVKYGCASAEKVWPFPMDQHYLDAIKSEIADLKQCNVTGNADHILAAKFLEQFVDKEMRWLHVDLASCRHAGGLGGVPSEISGVGVWFTCALVEDYLLPNAF